MGTWDYYGRHDPYFGVLSHDRYHSGALSEDARREFEKVFITRALQRSNGCLGDAAELLGIHRNTVTRKMAEYKIKHR